MIPDTDSFISHREDLWEDFMPGVKRIILGYNHNLMMVKVKLEKGAEVPEHHHLHVQASYIVNGVFRVTIHGETRILRSGDSFFIKPDLPHQVTVLEEGIIIDTFNPAREDFLNKNR